jgi:hypothetical protein
VARARLAQYRPPHAICSSVAHIQPFKSLSHLSNQPGDVSQTKEQIAILIRQPEVNLSASELFKYLPAEKRDTFSLQASQNQKVMNNTLSLDMDKFRGLP